MGREVIPFTQFPLWASLSAHNLHVGLSLGPWFIVVKRNIYIVFNKIFKLCGDEMLLIYFPVLYTTIIIFI